MEEKWMSIPGFPGYEVSNLGRVKSYKQNKNGKMLTLKPNHRGYLQARLQDVDGLQSSKYVHRLVLMAFAPVENMNELTVDHIDGDILNNRLDNLQWMTAADNLNKAMSRPNWGSNTYNRSKKGGQIKITFQDGHVEIYPNLMRAVEATGMCKRTINRYLENPNGFPGQRKKIKVELI